MAASTYFMFVRVSDNLILDARTEDSFDAGALSGYAVRSASFSADGGDSPDVNVAAPLPGGTFEEPSTYGAPPAAPVVPYIKLEWSGAGSPVMDACEVIADGVNTATLTAKKWDRTANEAIASGGESYWVRVDGAAFKPSVGKITLDVNGEGSVDFTPLTLEKGVGLISLDPATENNPPTNTAKLAAI